MLQSSRHNLSNVSSQTNSKRYLWMNYLQRLRYIPQNEITRGKQMRDLLSIHGTGPSRPQGDSRYVDQEERTLWEERHQKKAELGWKRGEREGRRKRILNAIFINPFKNIHWVPTMYWYKMFPGLGVYWWPRQTYSLWGKQTVWASNFMLVV